MYKTLNTSALGISGNQSEIIELALTYGFQAIDLDVADFATRVKLRGMPYARRLIDSAQIRVSWFQLPFDWETSGEVFQKNLEKLGGYAAAAAAVGCTRCLATVTAAGDVRPYHENFEFHRERFAQICKALEPSGTRLGVGYRASAPLRKDKAFQFIHEQDALVLLLKMVNAPNIGILLDVWDLIVSGGSVEAIRGMSAEQIVAVQLADLPEDVALTAATEEARLLPGTTDRVDTPAAMAILAELGYDGPVAVKPHRSVLGTTRRDPIVKRLGEALDAVWKAAGLTSRGKLTVSAES